MNQEVGNQIYRRTIFGVKVSPEGIQILHHAKMPLNVNGYNIEIKTVGDIFTHPNTPTGFNNMRRLEFHLEPSETVKDWKNECLAIRKFLMCLVEIRGTVPLNELKIHFCGSKHGSFDYWWDSEANALRNSPFHNTSMIEWVAQPLEDLRGIQRIPYVDYPSIPSPYGKGLTRLWKERFTACVCSHEPPATLSVEASRQHEQLNGSLIDFLHPERVRGEIEAEEDDVSAEILAEGGVTDDEEADLVEEDPDDICGEPEVAED
ncbi:hypothetical protein EV356DRAFT_502770 [Viridothelium virens]|uniref:Uncharacterized protein n=1 Tax=Viridothelium virens TaxID=1048519 RepID=A0A6A6H7Q4_VIRVR|nr:hypothetical protein EV356DRAFT_502770 [Viridothelium virens]